MDSLPSSVVLNTFTVEFSAEEIDDGRPDRNRSLVGRIFWALPKPNHKVLHAMARQWRIVPQDMEVLDIGHGLLQFVFPTEEDKTRIFQSQPWAFKSSIINLIPWEAPAQDLFDRLEFMPLTIQLKDLPTAFNTIKFGNKLLQPLGHLIETPDMSDASTSKQKPKHHKPIPYVFHTYVKAESANQSCPSVDASGSSSTVTIPPAPAAPLISGIFSLFHCYVPPYSNSPRISVVNNIPCHRRHHQPFKLIESYLHNHISFSYADPLLGNYFVVSVPLALADVEMSCIHALSDLQGMQLCDKKRPRDDDDAGTSTITLKKIKLPPLQVTDFPDIGMDLELLPDDLLDSDPDMIAVSAALTDSMGEEATPLRPPGPG
ncbi:hypothetical protein LINGRAHAP2_LOCUS4178 [Linum grandiflorum]